MKKPHLLKLFLIMALAPLPATVFGQFQEGPNGGVFTLTNNNGIQVGSDGESSFDPFGAGFDSSDQINFGSDSGWTQVGTGWTLIAASNAWALSAAGENEPSFEPVGQWFNPNFQWTAGQTGQFTIFSENGALSDIITVGNFGPGNTAGITFASDPSLSVPDSGSTLTMLSAAVIGLVALRRKLSA